MTGHNEQVYINFMDVLCKKSNFGKGVRDLSNTFGVVMVALVWSTSFMQKIK